MQKGVKDLRMLTYNRLNVRLKLIVKRGTINKLHVFIGQSYHPRGDWLYHMTDFEQFLETIKCITISFYRLK